MSDSLDELDEAIQLQENDFGELLGSCDAGPISLVDSNKDRVIEIVVCGSSWLDDGDNMGEPVYITRYHKE